MKILLLCNVKGNLGDAIRTFKIKQALEENYDVMFINLNNYFSNSKFRFFSAISFNLLRNHAYYRDWSCAKMQTFVDLSKDLIKKIIQKNKIDLIVAEGTILGYIAIKSSDSKIPVVTDVHGIATSEYYERTGKKDKYFEWISKIESEVFRKSFKLITVSHYMDKYILENFHISTDKIITVPNGSDVQKKVAKYNTSNLNIIYGGIYAFWEDIGTYLDLAKKSTDKYRFYIMGRGPDEKFIKYRIKKEKIKIVDLGYKNRDEALRVFSNMQIGVAPSTKGITRKVASPIKVFDYLACGLPVITPKVGEWSEIIIKNKCGIVTNNSDPDEFLKAIETLSDRKIWKHMASNAVKLIKDKYNWDILLRKLIDNIKRWDI